MFTLAAQVGHQGVTRSRHPLVEQFRRYKVVVSDINEAGGRETVRSIEHAGGRLLAQCKPRQVDLKVGRYIDLGGANSHVTRAGYRPDMIGSTVQ